MGCYVSPVCHSRDMSINYVKIGVYYHPIVLQRLLEHTHRNPPPSHISLRMSYANPLHNPVSSSQKSAYSALGNAMPSKAPDTSGRIRLPQTTFSPTSKWHGTTGKANLAPTIQFDYKGHSKQGVSMRELAARGVPEICLMIQGGEDKVLAHTGLQRVTFRILVCFYLH